MDSAIIIDSDDNCTEITQNEDALIEAAWNDKTGTASKVFANYIKQFKDASNTIPDKVLTEISKRKYTNKSVKNDKKVIESTLEELLKLHQTHHLFDERLVIRFLDNLHTTSIDCSKIKDFYKVLWKRLAMKQGSENLLRKLVILDFDYIKNKLDRIIVEANNEGSNVIQYCDGYQELFELCIYDSSGSLLQEVIKYFIKLVRKRKFIGNVTQEIAKLMINDVRYRITIKSFSSMFPEKLQFYIKLLQETDAREKKVIETMLTNLLKVKEDDFLTITIGFSEYTYLINKIYTN